MTSLKWKDSRYHKPSPRSSNIYPVIFRYCGSRFVGYALWLPKHDYADGDWTETRTQNGNPLTGGQVTHWHELLPWPEDVEV